MPSKTTLEAGRAIVEYEPFPMFSHNIKLFTWMIALSFGAMILSLVYPSAHIEIGIVSFSLLWLSLVFYVWSRLDKDKNFVIDIFPQNRPEPFDGIRTISANLWSIIFAVGFFGTIGILLIYPLFISTYPLLVSSQIPLSIRAIIFGGVATFLLSFATFLLFSYRLFDDYMPYYPVGSPQVDGLKGVIWTGMGILPKKARVGSSYSTWLDFDLDQDFLNGVIHRYPREYVEMELQGAGIKIDGKKKVRLSETSNISPIAWNLFFPNSGVQWMNVMISRITPSNKPSDAIKKVVFAYRHRIRVNNLISASWLPVLTVVLTMLSTAAALITALYHG